MKSICSIILSEVYDGAAGGRGPEYEKIVKGESRTFPPRDMQGMKI